ncbi:glycosyltransferase family 9 protein [Uliginosibacterium sp. 31-12]|uniref:glycosyltransferase family 9 protein n=1 Tax=Uliginosibacterium sp. 31-12 TaxID=3062781 RepID=UPI0026E27708|nr:tetratricopeptide repeat-containing glycosyltransferase family protein [Uliginosibacterium sp. 31-12]MDO6384976.1 tetratricopeptide repeat-containing glycosyltransferase family protein [Uliginosibacterium sp. 31-12]
MFGWFSRKSVSKLPSTLQAALETHSYPDVATELRSWRSKNDIAEDENKLLKAAKSCGWDDGSCRKISIFLRFYRNDYSGAFLLSKDLINPGQRFDADVFVLCINILHQNNQFEDAARLIGTISAETPLLCERGDYWTSRASVCWSVNDMPGVDEAIGRALILEPDNRNTLEISLPMYWELGCLDKFEASRSHLAALGLASSYPYSLCLLASGDYLAGFEAMEARYELDEAHRYLNQALLNLPRWNGVEDVDVGILVSSEQGFGDGIQMARYFHQLNLLTDKPVAVEVQPEVLSLFEHNFPTIRFVVRERGQRPAVDFDRWIGMMSLPWIFKTRLDNVPLCSGYLTVPEDSCDYWRERVAGLARAGKKRIGLAWSGQPAHRADRRRSIPFVKIVDSIRVCDADFFALQTVVPENLPANIFNVSEELLTLADTAGLIQQMDLVVAVDTSVVHIAGALGKPTLLLLPFRYEWRWGVEGESNPWYESVRVLRQLQAGDWDEMLMKVFRNEIPCLDERAVYGNAR